MEHSPIPVLDDANSRLDWLEAQYRPLVRFETGQVTIRHHVLGATELSRLVMDGDAVWYAEIRCPRTMLSRVRTSTSQHQVVQWKEDEVLGSVFVIPGLVTTRDTYVDTASLHPHIWGAEERVFIPAGWRCARGEIWRSQSLTVSLVTFKRAPEDTLAPGQMTVADVSTDAPKFTVTLASDVFEKCKTSRDMRIAGLVAVFALLPRSKMAEGGELADHSLTNELRGRLDDAGVPDWDDDLGYDPALAATAVEPFDLFVAEAQQ